jgi:hypothetical protein
VQPFGVDAGHAEAGDTARSFRIFVGTGVARGQEHRDAVQRQWPVGSPEVAVQPHGQVIRLRTNRVNPGGVCAVVEDAVDAFEERGFQRRLIADRVADRRRRASSAQKLLLSLMAVPGAAGTVTALVLV